MEKKKIQLEKGWLRKEIATIFAFRWEPSAELTFVVVSWVAVEAWLCLSFQLITIRQVALNFITYGPVTLFALGTVVPLVWTIKKGRPLADVGITSRRIAVSILLGIILSAIQYSKTLAGITYPPIEKMIPLVTLAVTVGLFEAFFFRGWVQLRFEKAFGIIPGIILGSAVYALYHVGYGMEWSEIGFLFIMGLIYAVAFRLTKNILLIWPLLTPMGGLFNYLKVKLRLPFEATYGFTIVLGLMLAFIVFALIWQKKREKAEGSLN